GGGVGREKEGAPAGGAGGTPRWAGFFWWDGGYFFQLARKGRKKKTNTTRADERRGGGTARMRGQRGERGGGLGRGSRAAR
ncbi:hypothetical protein B2I21_00545, partial [Chryseobacterium mucoviscidosis]